MIMNKNNLLDKIIEFYLENKMNDAENNLELKEMFKKDISDRVIADHKEELIRATEIEQNRVYEECENKRKKNILIDKIKEAKEIVFVAIVLGFFVGIVVNQVTEVILYLKGNSYNFFFTCGWTGAAIIAIWASCKFLYRDNIERLFSKDD
jgi:hypothetical protein